MQKDPRTRAADRSTSKKCPVFSGAFDYFSDNVLPEEIHAHIRYVKAPTSYVNNQGETFLLIRSGAGTMQVNGIEYSLQPDTLINLGPFHRYRLLPSGRDGLEIAEARMNSSTYVYMIANPYLKYEQFNVPQQPPVVCLRGVWAQIAGDAMDGLLSEAKNKSDDSIKLSFCHMMTFVGIITDHMSKEYFVPNKKNRQ